MLHLIYILSMIGNLFMLFTLWWMHVHTHVYLK